VKIYYHHNPLVRAFLRLMERGVIVCCVVIMADHLLHRLDLLLVRQWRPERQSSVYS
jgi:hypothetical protein